MPNPTHVKAVSPSAMLRARLAALRRKHVSVAALTGLAMAVAVGVEVLALTMFVDWWLELPLAVRVVLLLGQLAVLAYILFRSTLLPIRHQPDEDEVALMVEKARPEFRSRLISSIQLTRPGAIPAGSSTSLVDSTVEETEAIAAPIDFQRIVPTDKLLRLGSLALFVTVFGTMGLLYGGSTTGDLLKRAFLSNTPVPRKTRVQVPDGNKVIGLGDSVRLEALVEGITPAHGKIEVQYRTRKPQEFTVEQDKDNRFRFGRTIENVQDSFTYVFHLNDGRSAAFAVKAIPRPTVATIQCDQEFPAYTRFKPVRRALGDLSLLAGSRLKLVTTATKPIKTATIKLVGVDTETPMLVDPQNPRQLSGEFIVPAKGISGFSIHLLDTEAMESRDSAVYRIELLPDKAPVVRVTYPDRKEELLTRQATMIVGIDATDDFEIAHLRLRYRIDTVDEAAEKMVELDLEGQNPQHLRRRHEWKIGDIRPLLSEGSRIEYWIEAVDNNDATGPGIGVSEHQFAKVVSESEKRADLLNRAGDYLGSISDVASDQEKLNRSLGTIIREKSGLR